MKKIAHIIMLALLAATLLACSKSKISDGEYSLSVEKEGGTGKAYIESPVVATVTDGKAMVTIVWSSKNYDYMIVNGVKYLNEALPDEHSRFTFPLNGIPCDMNVIADTTAMSTPHEVEYVLHFNLPSNND